MHPMMYFDLSVARSEELRREAARARSAAALRRTVLAGARDRFGRWLIGLGEWVRPSPMLGRRV